MKLSNPHKPLEYNSLSPYLIVDNAQQLVDQLALVFDAKELRKYERSSGQIEHLELKIDDSILMICDSTSDFPARKVMLHCYVQDVYETFKLAMASGCKPIEKPESKEGDPDIRGSFYDCAGNYWAISTQKRSASTE